MLIPNLLMSTPKSIQESYNQILTAQELLKVIIKLDLHDRITCFTYEHIIDKTYTYLGRVKYREALAAAQLKSPNKWLRTFMKLCLFQRKLLL